MQRLRDNSCLRDPCLNIALEPRGGRAGRRDIHHYAVGCEFQRYCRRAAVWMERAEGGEGVEECALGNMMVLDGLRRASDRGRRRVVVRCYVWQNGVCP